MQAESDRRCKRAVVYALEAIASRFSHAELVQNPEDVDLLRRWRLVPRRKLAYLGNGVDLDRFDRSRVDPGTRASVRAELGVDDEIVVIGIVGRLVAEKGLPELFDALRRLGAALRTRRRRARRSRQVGRARSFGDRTGRARRRALSRHASRRRAPLRRDGRVRAAVASRRIPTRRDGGGRDGPADRRHRHPWLPPGRARRRQRVAGATTRRHPLGASAGRARQRRAEAPRHGDRRQPSRSSRVRRACGRHHRARHLRAAVAPHLTRSRRGNATPPASVETRARRRRSPRARS